MFFSRVYLRVFSFFVFASLTVLAALCLPFSDAFATSVSLGTGAEQVSEQISVVPKFIAVICYIIGTFFAVRALLALKGFLENMEDNPVTRFLALASTAALLISLPYIIDLTANTIGAHYGESTNITSSSSSYSDDGN